MTVDNEGDGASAHTTSHKSDRMTGRIEIVGRVSGRRTWTPHQKLEILHDAFGPGGSVREAIELHEVSSGLLYTWRRQAMSGELAGIKPVVPLAFAEVEVAQLAAPVATEPSRSGERGQIVIELPTGVKLTVDATVDAAALDRVIGVLGR